MHHPLLALARAAALAAALVPALVGGLGEFLALQRWRLRGWRAR